MTGKPVQLRVQPSQDTVDREVQQRVVEVRGEERCDQARLRLHQEERSAGPLSEGASREPVGVSRGGAARMYLGARRAAATLRQPPAETGEASLQKPLCVRLRSGEDET